MSSKLDLEGVIGFSGHVKDGLIVHPDNQHLIYPLGSTVVVREINKPREQVFLQGHSDSISCLTLSPSGRFIASGQKTHMGFQADVCIWDFETKKLIHRLRLHQVKVQALTFTHDDMYLASLGGADDNNLVVWDVESGQSICGAPASNDATACVSFFNNRHDALVTAGRYTLRVWEFDRENRKIRPTDCNLGQLKRAINCMMIDQNDEFVYCGTSTGDVLQVSLENKLFKMLGPPVRLSKGINAVTESPSGDIIVGSGDGTVAGLSRTNLRILRSTNLLGAVTSLAPHYSGDLFFCGTDHSNVYWVKYDGLSAELRNTCHYHRINDVAFPTDFSGVFATCSMNDIRIWRTETLQELLRIEVPNVECNCVAFTNDGKCIISGWGDGKIRAFGPQSGRLLYVINDAHHEGVTAIACTSDCSKIVSGGEDGTVRVWKVTSESRVMIASMKEHKSTVNSVKIRADDSECVSASSDGSCIVWNMARFVRNQSLFASTFFQDIFYHPDESQLVTTGSDRKITYWDAYDGNTIRIIDGSDTDELNTLACCPSGEWFASGGADKRVRFWHYDEGTPYAVGNGHSGSITGLSMSPDGQVLVSVGDEGAIFVWKNPGKVLEAASALEAASVEAADEDA